MVDITLATADDAGPLAALVNAAYRGETARRGWSHEAELIGGQRTDPATLRESLLAGAWILMLRDGDGALCGCVSVAATEAPDVWYLGMLTIDPRRQAAGLGRRLMQAGEDHASARGARRLVMTVIQVRESLIAWYERRGYRRTGETQPFPYGDDRFGRPERNDLHFVVLEKAVSPGRDPTT